MNLVNFMLDFILKYIVFCVIPTLTFCYCVNWRLKGGKISSVPVPSLPLSVFRLLIFGNILLAFLSPPCTSRSARPLCRSPLEFLSHRCWIVSFTLNKKFYEYFTVRMPRIYIKISRDFSKSWNVVSEQHVTRSFGSIRFGNGEYVVVSQTLTGSRVRGWTLVITARVSVCLMNTMLWNFSSQKLEVYF